jgi:hypothetical protein
MDCSRCHGFMVTIRLEDAESSTSCGPLVGWQCLSCGEVSEPGIIANRKGHHEPTYSRARLQYGVWLAKADGLNRKPK